jgi:hypothetical protein
MADDYKHALDRFLDEQRLRDLDAKHQENLATLAEHYGVSPELVMRCLRPRPGTIVQAAPDGAGKVHISSRDFRDAPAGLTDRELSDWAVRKIGRSNDA